MKKTMFCRLILMLLALVTVMSVVACQKDDDPTQNNNGTEEKVTDEPSLIDQLPTVTYNYTDFTLLMMDSEDHIDDMIMKEVTSTSAAVDSKVYERNEAIMERYQIELQYVAKKQGDEFKAAVIGAESAGADVYDVVVGHGRDLFEGVISGKYIDWYEMEYLNLKSPWWNQNVLNSFTHPTSGKVYVMNGDLSYLSVGSTSALFFNKKMIADASLTSPYDLVESGEWTFENYKIMATQVGATFPENESKNDIENGMFSYATSRWKGPYAVIIAAGGAGLVLKENGTYDIGYNDELIGTAFSKWREFVLETNSVHWDGAGSNEQAIREAFMADRVCFQDDDILCAAIYKTSEVDYGIVPWPKAAEGASYCGKIGSGTNSFAVMRNVSEDNLSRIGLILEAMAVYGHVEVIPYYFDDILCLQGAKDERAREMLQLIHNNLVVDFSEYINIGGLANVPQNVMRNPGTYGTTLSTGVKVVETKVMTELEKWYELVD